LPLLFSADGFELLDFAALFAQARFVLQVQVVLKPIGEILEALNLVDVLDLLESLRVALLLVVHEHLDELRVEDLDVQVARREVALMASPEKRMVEKKVFAIICQIESNKTFCPSLLSSSLLPSFSSFSSLTNE